MLAEAGWLASGWVPVVLAPFVGSLLGVLIVRLPEREPVVWTRSHCRSCRRPLGPLQLIPLLSFVVQQGRCRHCDAPIGWFYPAVELAAVGVALWAWSEVDGGLLWASCTLGWVLLALAVIDARQLLLPDVLTLPLLAVGLAVAALVAGLDWREHAIAAAAGFAAFWAIGAVYRRLRGRDGLGGGDAKLLAAAGAWVSWPGLPGVVLIGAVATLAVELLRRALAPTAMVPGTHGDVAGPDTVRDGNGASGRSADGSAAGGAAAGAAIPFGPGLCFGLWIVWLYGPLRFAVP